MHSFRTIIGLTGASVAGMVIGLLSCRTTSQHTGRHAKAGPVVPDSHRHTRLPTVHVGDVPIVGLRAVVRHFERAHALPDSRQHP